VHSVLDSNIKIHNIIDLFRAKENDITFLNSIKFKEKSLKSKATACITNKKLTKYLPENCIKITVDNILLSAAKVSKLFYPESEFDYLDQTLISAEQIKDKYIDVKFGKNVLIGENVKIGKNTIIGNNSIIEHDVKGVMAFSPDKETAIPFDGDGYMLNRQKLPEIQNARTKKMGVNFDFEINLTGLIYDGQQVIGVQGVNNKTNPPYKKTAKVVVDATGVTSMLRNQLQNSTKIERKIDRRDLESTGRHIMYFENGEKDLTEYDPDYSSIHLDQDIAPGG